MKQIIQGQLNDIPLDESAVSQSSLNIEEKIRSNLFPWNGQFSPQLVAALLDAYSNDSDFILDPFMGSGTVLVEAARLGLSAFGSDINPAPFKIASTYRFVMIGAERRREVLNHVERLLDEAFPSSWFQLDSSPISEDHLKTKLVDISKQLSVKGGTPNDSLTQLSQIAVDALIVLVDFNKPALSTDRIFRSWRKLRKCLSSLPHSRRKIEVANCDARQLPLTDSCVDLVITSPPYINVFNYHQKYRRSMEAIGWDLLHVARSEIGSNRKHRGNRYLTVTQYCLDMAAVFSELCRVCSPEARMIFVLGRESNVRKTAFYNGDLIARIVHRCLGLEVICRQERVFNNRFGASIIEDILHFRNSHSSNVAATPTDIAYEILSEAQIYAPDESRADLRDAIEQVDCVEESPLYGPITTPLDRTIT